MADYLIGLSIGPVQGFIASARRTRDLWFGSYLLSEIAKAAARDWQQQAGTLIFPAPDRSEDLNAGSGMDVGNKIMAVFATDQPGQVLESAKDAAKDHWQQLTTEVFKKHAEHICNETWQAQVEDILELFGAWVAIGSEENAYSNARQRLETLLNARKATRNFQPAATAFTDTPGFGKFKSSLDAARETVLEKSRPAWFRRMLGLSKGEELDCPGLIKRLGASNKPFAAVPRIALEAWLDQHPDADLTPFNQACEDLVEHHLITRSNDAHLSRLPYDGAYLFAPRIEAELSQLDSEDTNKERKRLNDLKQVRDTLHGQFGEPTPYFAVLVADGDHMGALIDSKHNTQEHIELTQALTRFAAEARNKVINHQGTCVYAGGDDVLALLPVHRAVQCADALRKSFAEIAAPLAPSGATPPSLSVGLGIGHILTPFNRLLDLGRRAEQLAKNGPPDTPETQQRNALAVLIGVRSGAELALRGRWDEPTQSTGITQRLLKWTQAYQNDQVSDKTPFDLRTAARRMAWAANEPDRETILAAEISRVLKKKRTQGGEQELSPAMLNNIVTAIEQQGFEPIINELLAARWLAQKAKD